MNIFVVDYNPQIATQYHNDKLVVKMSTEVIQMMCTNIYVLHGLNSKRKAYSDMNIVKNVLFPMFPKRDHAEYDFYKLVMPNHPCTIWMRESRKNFDWSLEYLKYLFFEYKFRYNKNRDSEEIYNWICDFYPYDKLPDVPQTKFKLAISDESLHHEDPVVAYKNYFRRDKVVYTDKRFPGKVFKHTWKKRGRPSWISEEDVKLAYNLKLKESLQIQPKTKSKIENPILKILLGNT